MKIKKVNNIFPFTKLKQNKTKQNSSFHRKADNLIL